LRGLEYYRRRWNLWKVDLNSLAISGKIYGSLAQMTESQFFAVSIEMLYRFLMTVIGDHRYSEGTICKIVLSWT